jgi:hypothetical protein
VLPRIRNNKVRRIYFLLYEKYSMLSIPLNGHVVEWMDSPCIPYVEKADTNTSPTMRSNK